MKITGLIRNLLSFDEGHHPGKRQRWRLRLQRYLFTLLFLTLVGLLAWLSTQYHFETDWTYGARNSLSQESVQLLQTLQGPLRITAFARKDEQLRSAIRDLVARYQRVSPRVQLEFVNPDTHPDEVRERNIQVDGELVVSYQGRSEKIQEHTEQALTNAILRVARQGERWVAFLSGHGDRNPEGQANFDLGRFGAALKRKGIRVERLNLAAHPRIPDNVSVLVIASPQTHLLPGEIRLVRQYLDRGGNLLWLADPGETGGLDSLAEYLGIEFLPGVVVDANTQLVGIRNPAFVLVPEYPAHAITRDLTAMTLFPRALALEWQHSDHWQATGILRTLPRTWTETGKIQGEIRYDKGTDERAGPLDIAFALSRERKEDDPQGQTDKAKDDAKAPVDGTEGGEQRVVVCGDGDFLSNAYLGNGGNLELGLKMIDWLSHDDAFISIQPRPAPDKRLDVSPARLYGIGIALLFVVPGLLAATGIGIWLRRRRL